MAVAVSFKCVFGLADVKHELYDTLATLGAILLVLGLRGAPAKKVVAVASGRWHNLAVVEGGELFAWGAADASRCGFADTTDMPRDEDNWP